MKFGVLVVVMLLLPVFSAQAAGGVPALSVTGDPTGGQTYSVTLQILALMTLLSLLPTLLLTMTAFTRIMIVFALLRQALGTSQTPSNQILLGLSLFLTIFIMLPVFDRVNTEAVQPYLSEELNFIDALQQASLPFREFMLKQTREADIELFLRIADHGDIDSADQVPFSILVPAYVTSELKTAFQIGFMIFLPFLIIDLVVSSVLMSMGMMMLSPMIISLPFKLMLFVLVDGWALIIETLAGSFYA